MAVCLLMTFSSAQGLKMTLRFATCSVWVSGMRICLAVVLSLCLLAAARAEEAVPRTAAAEEAGPPAAIVLEPGENPPPFVQLTPDQPPIIWDARHVGEFHLVDQAGQPVSRESLLGEQWVANFIFTRCAYQCPLTCRRIMELNEELAGVPVRFFTLTVDPEHDTVPVMHEFADIWKAKPDRWLFVTGEPDQVWDLIRTGFKVAAWENVGTARQPGMEFAHNNHLIHIDAQGVILGRYDSGVESELRTLARVLKGQIETPLKYRPAMANALEELTARHAEKSPSQASPADPLEKLPAWAKRLPATNAALNALAACLLMTGLFAVKRNAFRLHKRLMLTAFFVSVAFLGCYLTYHYALHEYAGVRGKPFPGTGSLKSLYYGILVSHVVLAAIVPVLAIVTIRNGLRAYPEHLPPEEREQRLHERRVHHRWAKVTFPVWMYVSVTGVVIYWMLYRMY